MIRMGNGYLIRRTDVKKGGKKALDSGQLVILSENRPFCHLPCRFVHFSGIGPGFVFPIGGSDKELRE